MGILSQMAPSIGDVFKLMVLSMMAVAIGLMVVSMASAYEASAMIDLGIESVAASGLSPLQLDTESFLMTAR